MPEAASDEIDWIHDRCQYFFTPTNLRAISWFMSQDFIIAKRPQDINEYHSFIRWLETAVERDSQLESFRECEPEIREFVEFVAKKYPILDISPKDSEIKISRENELSSWVRITCCNSRVIDLSFRIEDSLLDRKIIAFERAIATKAKALKLYVVFDREILVGERLEIDPRRSPEYRKARAKAKIVAAMPKLSEELSREILSRVELSFPLRFEFVDHPHHPSIVIQCAEADLRKTYASFEQCKPELFKILKKVSKFDVNFQVVKKS